MRALMKPGRSWPALLGVIAIVAACADRQIPTEARLFEETVPSRLVVPATGVYTQVTVGTTSTCALRNDGVVACWGSNSFGQAPPTKAAATGTFTSVSSFFNHRCAVRSDGAIECWGSNDDGQAPPLVSPPSGTSFVDVGVGTQHSCATRSDGIIQCWGVNDHGEAPPTRSASSGTFIAVSTGGSHTCGLTSTGTIECWGWDGYNQAPESFAATTGSFVDVFTAQIRTCGLRTDGVVQCVSTQTPAISGTFLHYAGYRFEHECGVNTSGVAQCVGDNDHGEAPATRAATSGTFTQIAVGYQFTCALRSDGAIECWGETQYGAMMQVNPTATFTAPASVIAGQPISLALTNAQVPGYPWATAFTYAFDCGDGFAFSEGNTASCATSTTGTRSVGGRVYDQHFTATTYTATVTVKSAQEGTTDLRTEISIAPLAPDIRKALMTKLNSALTALDKGKTAAACSALKDFINQVNAQRGKAIDAATADAWILAAQALQTAIGC